MTDWVAVCGYAHRLAADPCFGDTDVGAVVHRESYRHIRDAITEAL